MASVKVNNVYLGEHVSISTVDEKVTSTFHIKDIFLNEKTVEKAEVKMQKLVISSLANSVKPDILLGADLSNQIAISSKAADGTNIPYLGLYNACASFTEEIIIASGLLKFPKIKNVFSVVSSHNLVAERTFRYPIEYGSLRRGTQTYTATAALAVNLSNIPTNIKVESFTVGTVTNYNMKDVNNMGAIMAPAAARTLLEHLTDLKREVSYYDLILTGDLGKIGSILFKELLKKDKIIIRKHMDAGKTIISDTNLSECGGSGPVCLPIILLDKIVKERKYNRILILGTGSLQNTTIVNQKQTVPAICHAVSLEVTYE